MCLQISNRRDRITFEWMMWKLREWMLLNTWVSLYQQTVARRKKYLEESKQDEKVGGMYQEFCATGI